MKTGNHKRRGFTLVELLVALPPEPARDEESAGSPGAARASAD